ncbi:MAG: hypothetical protein ACOZIN_21955 [Myxococcota bacterium]
MCANLRAVLQEVERPRRIVDELTRFRLPKQLAKLQLPLSAPRVSARG